jgi:ACS family glucarate transporter-like MFS transporter
MVRGFSALLGVRLLFGVAEAGAFPGAARAIFNWLPAAERGRANGILMSGTRLGAAFAFPLMAWLLDRWSWRSAFYILALPGLIWALVWAVCFRNDPPGAPQARSACPNGERSFRRVLASRAMLLNMFQYFSGNFTFFLCISWMLPYLESRYGLSAGSAAAYSMIPLAAGGAAQWLSGFLVDALYRSPLKAWSRRLPAMAGFALAAAAIFAAGSRATAAGAVACFAAATFGADMTISPSWVYAIDLGGKNSGAISGSMNMLGNLGSFASVNAFPWLYSWTGSASAYFAVAALLNLLSIVCWARMRPAERAPG